MKKQKELRVKKIYSGGSTVDDSSFLYDGHYHLAFIDADEEIVRIKLTADKVKKLFSLCQIEMIYSGIDYKELLQENESNNKYYKDWIK